MAARHDAERVREALVTVVAALDPGQLSGGDAVVLVETFTAIERLAVAGRTLCLRAAADSGAWTMRRRGARTPADWVAATLGVSSSQAFAELLTAERLEQLPATQAAVRAGKLSAAQAREIADTAAVAPAAEQAMLAAAETEGVQSLQRRGRAARAAAAANDQRRHEKIRQGRYLRHWTDHDGAFRADLRTTPEAGAELLARLRPFQDELFEQARQADQHESTHAYAADALLEMARAATPGNGSGTVPAKVIARVDVEALQRGHAVEGEVCEIDGVGPVPVPSLRALLGDAFLALVITRGVDILNVTHVGRHIPEAVRTALEWRDPECVTDGCAVQLGLEIDHVVDYAKGGPTALGNLGRLCPIHHDVKTYGRAPP